MKHWSPNHGDYIVATATCHMYGDADKPSLTIGKTYKVFKDHEGAFYVDSNITPFHYFSLTWHKFFKPSKPLLRKHYEPTTI